PHYRAADGVEARAPLKKRVVEDPGKRLVAARCGGEQLLGEERVSLRALVDRRCELRRRRLGHDGHQLLDLLPIERPELENGRLAGTEKFTDDELHCGRAQLIASVRSEADGALLADG